MRKIKRRNWRVARDSELFGSAKNFRMLEKKFWDYTEIKKAVNEVRAEQGYYQSGHSENSGGGHSFISDPTARIGIEHAELLESVVIKTPSMDDYVVDDPEKWIMVVEKTLEHFKGSNIGEVLNRRYLKNESIWVTCSDLSTDTRVFNKDKYCKARDFGIQYAKECAIQLGLITVF